MPLREANAATVPADSLLFLLLVTRIWRRDMVADFARGNFRLIDWIFTPDGGGVIIEAARSTHVIGTS